MIDPNEQPEGAGEETTVLDEALPLGEDDLEEA